MFIPVEVRLAYRRGLRRASSVLVVAAGLSAPFALQSVCGHECVVSDIGVQLQLDVRVQLKPHAFGVIRLIERRLLPPG